MRGQNRNKKTQEYPGSSKKRIAKCPIAVRIQGSGMCLLIPRLSMIIYTKLMCGRLTQAVNGEGGIAGDSVSNHFPSYILKVMPIRFPGRAEVGVGEGMRGWKRSHRGQVGGKGWGVG